MFWQLHFKFQLFRSLKYVVSCDWTEPKLFCFAHDLEPTTNVFHQFNVEGIVSNQLPFINLSSTLHFNKTVHIIHWAKGKKKKTIFVFNESRFASWAWTEFGYLFWNIVDVRMANMNYDLSHGFRKFCYREMWMLHNWQSIHDISQLRCV